MTKAWQKRLLLTAATWNLLGGITALLDPGRHIRQLFTVSLSLGDPLQLFFFRCVWINVIAWGLAYLLAAFWANSRKAVFAAGAAGKAGYAVACFALVPSGIGTSGLLVAGAVDLALAAGFVAAFLSLRTTGR